MEQLYITILIMIFLVLLIFIIWYISMYNKLKIAVIKIEESLSGIDVALTKRYSTLTKIIEVVKGYAKHEKEVLFEIVKLRENMSMKERNEANYIMDETARKINVFVENYPEIKASDNFMVLQRSIVDVEEHLQAARRFYNANVSLYNQMLDTYPSNIVAKISGMMKKDFFEADTIAKENVNMNFN